MIVDTSAIVSILLAEPGWETLDQLLQDAPAPRMSAATYLETSIVLDSRASATLSRRLDQLLKGWGITIEPVTAEQARIARAAYRDYGRGSGHSARLNYGDVFSYALAAERGEPILFVGDDFTHTDVVAATPQA